MGAIAGAVGFIDQTIEKATRKMIAALAHRGSAGSGMLSRGTTDRPGFGAILGATQSGTIGPGKWSKQPLLETKRGLALVHNGAVYNYRDLREELRQRGEAFESTTDTEVVLKAFATWGSDFLERLEGMFALAIWDPNRRSVLLARDRLGFKPLYWGRFQTGTGERTILFASEVRALLATGLFPRRVDPVGLETYAWNGFFCSPHSIVRGIHCLPPGNAIEVSEEGVASHPRHYWSLGDYEGGAKGNEGIATALKRAVTRQLDCNLPVGLFLSGGIDSSAVAALASEISTARLPTFNIAFAETDFDESSYARAVAQALGTEHSEILITQESFEKGVERSLGSLDQPTFDGLNTFLVSSAVRDAGIQVALGGTGGDDLFGGNRTFIEIPFVAKWGRRLSHVPEPLLRSLARVAARLKTGPRGAIPHQTRWGKLADVLSARGELLDLYQLTYALFTSDFIDRLLEHPPSGQVRTGLPQERYKEIEMVVKRNPEIYAITFMELAIFLGERLLRDLDTAGGAVDLEIRAPLLDDLVIQAWKVTDPPISYQPMGVKKILLDVALSRLDRRLFERPKMGFVLPIDRWCRGRLGPLLDQYFFDAEHCRSVGINPHCASSLWTAFKRGDAGLYWSRVWALFVFLWWCKEHGLEIDQ